MKARLMSLFFIIILLISIQAQSSMVLLSKRLNDVDMLASYIKNVNYKISGNTASKIAQEIIDQSNLAGIPWEIVACMAQTESSFNPNAVGVCGEIGLLQILESNCRKMIIDKGRLKDIRYNVSCGICIFKDKLRMNNGDLNMAILRYNGAGSKALEYKNLISLRLIIFLEFKNKYFGNN